MFFVSDVEDESLTNLHGGPESTPGGWDFARSRTAGRPAGWVTCF